MAEVKFTPPATVAIGGLGVIGGSVALALKERGVNVVGFAGREDTALARKAGILTAETLIAAARGAQLVLLAVPVRVLRQASIVVHETTDAPVLHAASVQRPSSLGFAPGEWVPIGTHPLAGSHKSGFAGADPQMFRGARVSVETRANAAERAAAQWLWTTLGASKIELRDSEAHDRQVAWISHLPQLASVGLAAAIANSGEKALALGPGGRDATRLAGSRFELWREIVGANADDVAKALEALEGEMRSMREAIVSGSDDALKKQWERARSWREAAGGKP